MRLRTLGHTHHCLPQAGPGKRITCPVTVLPRIQLNTKIEQSPSVRRRLQHAIQKVIVGRSFGFYIWRRLAC